MELSEKVFSDGKLLAYVIRNELSPDKTSFITPPDINLQLGFVVYPAGGQVLRHLHRPIERHITGTTEILFIKKGRCFMDIFDDQQKLVAVTHQHRHKTQSHSPASIFVHHLLLH